MKYKHEYTNDGKNLTFSMRIRENEKWNVPTVSTHCNQPVKITETRERDTILI